MPVRAPVPPRVVPFVPAFLAVPRSVAPVLALACLAAAWAAGPAAADTRLFRPLTADPRENQTHWRMMTDVEDLRYGADITDSTSHGGVDPRVHGRAWEAAAGETFRWRPLRRIGGVPGPWLRYQLGFPTGVFATFDGFGSLIDSDFQFGASMDALWRGDYDDARGITDFRRTVVTSRLTVFHRSSHLGDEYLALSRFGRNQQGYGVGAFPFSRPPVKRVDLSYEALSLVVSTERRLGVSAATLRTYGGGEWKVSLPFSVGGLIPANFTSPAARVGLELRSEGDADVASGVVARTLNRVLGGRLVGSEWLGALDLRLARPYNFAASDNPNGETEVWTPRLWTTSRYGREFRHYAGSWHALVGATVRSVREADGDSIPRGGPEWIVALEWYHGYAFDGQFLDQRLSFRPRAYVIPSLTAHF